MLNIIVSRNILQTQFKIFEHSARHLCTYLYVKVFFYKIFNPLRTKLINNTTDFLMWCWCPTKLSKIRIGKKKLKETSPLCSIQNSLQPHQCVNTISLIQPSIYLYECPGGVWFRNICYGMNVLNGMRLKCIGFTEQQQ